MASEEEGTNKEGYTTATTADWIERAKPFFTLLPSNAGGESTSLWDKRNVDLPNEAIEVLLSTKVKYTEKKISTESKHKGSTTQSINASFEVLNLFKPFSFGKENFSPFESLATTSSHFMFCIVKVAHVHIKIKEAALKGKIERTPLEKIEAEFKEGLSKPNKKEVLKKLFFEIWLLFYNRLYTWRHL